MLLRLLLLSSLLLLLSSLLLLLRTRIYWLTAELIWRLWGVVVVTVFEATLG